MGKVSLRSVLASLTTQKLQKQFLATPHIFEGKVFPTFGPCVPHYPEIAKAISGATPYFLGESLPYVRALRPSLPRNCKSNFWLHLIFLRGKSSLRSGLASLTTQKLQKQFLAPSHIFWGKVFPSLQPASGLSLPLLRDKCLLHRRRRYTPSETFFNARNAQKTLLYGIF